jgi:excisionase family DNA binding protein
MVTWATATEVLENKFEDGVGERDDRGGCYEGRLRKGGPMTELLEAVVETDQAGQGSEAATKALLTIDDLAALLGCSRRTVHRLIERGRVPKPCRFGSLLRWPRAQVDEWVARGCPDCRSGINRN